MTHTLPPALLARFAPRPPLPYLPPVEKKRLPPYQGLVSLLNATNSSSSNGGDNNNSSTETEVKKEEVVKMEEDNTKVKEEGEDSVKDSMEEEGEVEMENQRKPTPPPKPSVMLPIFEDPSKVDFSKFRPLENREQRKERKTKERLLAHQEELKQKIAQWQPQTNEKATSDPTRTLFVARISYETTESKLKREFEIYGTVKKVVLAQDLNGKSRGYAFVEFEREKDMRTAYKTADGKKIDGKRVLVDIERGRTLPDWRPRRLGGGLGGTRIGGDDVNIKYSGREPPPRADGGSSGGYDRSSGGSRSGLGYSSRDSGGGGEKRGEYRDRDRGEYSREFDRRDRSSSGRERYRSRSRERDSGSSHSRRESSGDYRRGSDRDRGGGERRGGGSGGRERERDRL